MSSPSVSAAPVTFETAAPGPPGGLDRVILMRMLDRMTDAERYETLALIRELDERTYYQLRPEAWMADVLGVPLHTIIWSMHPAYAEKGYLLPGCFYDRPNGDGEVYDRSVWDGTPDPMLQILRALADWKDCAVESATGTGKTYLAACIVLWFLAVFPGAMVVTVAPKEDQLKLNLWKEVGRLFPRFQRHYPHAKRTYLRLQMEPGDEALSDAWVAYGFVAGVAAGEESATKARGIHAQHLLFILEEANGIPPAVMEAIENTCTGPHNLRLALGNPNATTDPLHQMALRQDVVHVRVSAMDFPNLVANDPAVDAKYHEQVIDGAVSWKSVLNRRDKYGPEPDLYENHPLYKAMVRGICPSGSAHSLFTLRTLETVEQRLGARLQRGHRPKWEKVHRPRDGFPCEGVTRVYDEARHTHVGRYVIFGDVGGDEGTGDYHAAVVLDRVTKRVAAMVRMRGDRRFYIEELLRLGKLYRVYHWKEDLWHWPLLCWECNAVGALILDPTFRAYPNLYRQRPIGKPKQGKQRNAYGWFTSSANRSDMIEELGEWGHSLRTHPDRVPDALILEEMKVFEWSEKRRRYEAREKCHDDLMMALAGALTLDKALPAPIAIPKEPSPQEKSRTKREQKLQRQVKKNRRRGRKGPSGAFDQGRLPKTFA